MDELFLKKFFSKEFEEEINNKMYEYSYEFEYKLVYEYINQILSIPLNDYLDYSIKNYDVFYLQSSDIIQASKFKNATFKVCKVIKEAGDKGFSMIEIGKLLENDNKKRNDGAYRKYGENQSKTALELGLLHCSSRKYFLSCLGFVINDIDSSLHNKLFSRLLFRNKLIKRLFYKAATKGSVSFYAETKGLLRNTTIGRRATSVRGLLKYLRDNDECDFKDLIDKIEI